MLLLIHVITYSPFHARDKWLRMYTVDWGLDRRVFALPYFEKGCIVSCFWFTGVSIHARVVSVRCYFMRLISSSGVSRTSLLYHAVDDDQTRRGSQVPRDSKSRCVQLGRAFHESLEPLNSVRRTPDTISLTYAIKFNTSKHEF